MSSCMWPQWEEPITDVLHIFLSTKSRPPVLVVSWLGPDSRGHVVTNLHHLPLPSPSSSVWLREVGQRCFKATLRLHDARLYYPSSPSAENAQTPLEATPSSGASWLVVATGALLDGWGGGSIFISVKSTRNPIIIQQRPTRGETKPAPPTDAGKPIETGWLESQLRGGEADLKVVRSEEQRG